MVVELTAEVLSSFLLFDIVGFSLLLTLPLIMSKEEKKAGEKPLETLLDWYFIISYNMSRPYIVLIGFLYILSALFIMAYFLFGLPYGVLGAHIAFGTTIIVLALLVLIPYSYFALKFAVKVLSKGS